MSSDELVAWADELIATLDRVPGYLYAISLSESLAHVPRLDLVLDRIDDVDGAIVAERLVGAYQNRRIDLDRIGATACLMA